MTTPAAGPLPVEQWDAERRMVALALAMLSDYYAQQGEAFAADAEAAWCLAETWGATGDPA